MTSVFQPRVTQSPEAEPPAAAAYKASHVIDQNVTLTAADEKAVDAALAGAQERGDRALSRDAIANMVKSMKAIGLEGVNLDEMLAGRKTRLSVSYE